MRWNVRERLKSLRQTDRQKTNERNGGAIFSGQPAAVYSEAVYVGRDLQQKQINRFKGGGGAIIF